MGISRNSFSLLAAFGLAAGAVVAPASSVQAQEEAAPDYVSGVIGVDWYSHFVSYGFDVWGGGNDFGDNSTLNPYAEISVEIGEVTVFAGTWWDLNDNAANTLGGNFQEVDVWIGASYGYENFSGSIVYQSWNYGGGTEHILDLNLGYDDTGLLIDDFAFNPGLTVHNRIAATDGLAGLQEGTILVLGIEPGFTIIDTADYTVDMSIPVNIGFSFEDTYFTAAGDDGYAFTSVGLAFSMPITFIPEGYGAWSVNAGLTYYFTESAVYANVDNNFLVGNVGLSLSF